MTLQQLEYIVSVESERNFNRAAEKCFVTQPTLSMQIQKLEEELGVEIFDRNQKPVQATKDGSLIISKARQILKEAYTITSFAKKEHQVIEGEFKIGVIPTLAPYLLPLFLQDFSTKHPKTILQIEELYTRDIINRLLNNTLDIGLVVTPINIKDIREVPLSKESFYIFTSEDHPYYTQTKVDYSTLTDEGLWLLEQGHCFRNQVLNICGRTTNKKSNIKYESGSIEALKNIIKKNYGYTLVPELSIIDESKNNIRSFVDPIPVREVSLVVKSTFLKENLIKNFKKSILDSLPEELAKVTKGLLINIEE